MVASSFDDWVNQNKDVIKEKTKVASFQIRVESNEMFNEQNRINGKIIIGENKQFRFEMGPRIVVSDGEVWKSYDERTDQIFIQEPDKQLEKSLFSWVQLRKIKSLPVKLESDGGYRVTLLGKENNVRVYFNPGSNELESVVIFQSDIKSEISNITLAIEETLNLEIGRESSDSFDMR